MNRRQFLAIVGGALLAAACQAQTAPLPDYWPTRGWRTARPTDHGMAATLDAAVATRVAELPFLDGLAIIRHGYIVHEHYANGYTADARHDIASVTKGWTASLVGLARARGLLPDLDAALPTLLPHYFRDGAYADKAGITLRHLLMMRSGIDFVEDLLDTGAYGGPELLEQDVTAFGLGFPVAHAPGAAWNYSTLDTQLIAAVVQTAVGEPLADFARSSLFDPLGVGATEWWADGVGTTIGGQNLSMSLRDMAKLGLLYLHQGVWEGKPLLPRTWVSACLTPQSEPAYFPVTDQREPIHWYGYHWWLWSEEWFFGYRSFQAAGYGGQQVLVFPALDLIVAVTANLVGVTPETSEAQRAAIYALIHEVIFPELTDVTLTT